MKVFSVIRTTLLVTAVLGACVTDAKKHKLCDADGHVKSAPVPLGAAAPVPAGAPGAPGNQTVTYTVPSGKVVGDPAESKGTPNQPAPNAPLPQVPTNTTLPATPAGGLVTSAGTIKASFAYKGSNAGGPGTYQMVTDFATCTRKPHSCSSPISPWDDDLSIVLRGPSTVLYIGIFEGVGDKWNRVSSFVKGGATENMVFMTNHNIDYNGKSSPQGFASSDGRASAQSPQPFSGVLGSATSPNGFSIYADEKTGAEVNIFQNKKCGVDVECPGYYDPDGTAYYGWAGVKKIFITKVQMSHGGAPDVPALWALNGQILRSSQYGCNCRLQGGCGELDIAEVIPENLDFMSTHLYKYDSSTGNDTWSKRPVDAPTVYITIIDVDFGVKVLEIDDFDFTAGAISNDVVAKWLSA